MIMKRPTARHERLVREQTDDSAHQYGEEVPTEIQDHSRLS
jgi:hypothetical protein